MDTVIKAPSVTSVKIIANPTSVGELGDNGKIEVIALNEDAELSLKLNAIIISTVKPNGSAPDCTTELPLEENYEGEPDPIPPGQTSGPVNFDVAFEDVLSTEFTYLIIGKLDYFDGSENTTEEFTVLAAPVLPESLPVS